MGELEGDKVNEHTRNNQGSLESQSSYSWSAIVSTNCDDHVVCSSFN